MVSREEILIRQDTVLVEDIDMGHVDCIVFAGIQVALIVVLVVAHETCT